MLYRVRDKPTVIQRGHTIELILVSSSASQLRALHLMSGQEHVQEKAQQIIAEHS